MVQIVVGVQTSELADRMLIFKNVEVASRCARERTSCKKNDNPTSDQRTKPPRLWLVETWSIMEYCRGRRPAGLMVVGVLAVLLYVVDLYLYLYTTVYIHVPPIAFTSQRL